MKKINVQVKSVKVASFSPARQEISFIILFNDGKDKEITKNMAVLTGPDAAHQIIKDIRKVETSLNAEFDGKAVLDSYTNIIINDEDKVGEKLAFFLSKVFEKVKVVKNRTTADGYIKLLSDVNGMKIDF